MAGPIWQLIDSSAIGGIERHIEMLARGLRRLDIDCEVILFASYGHNPWYDQLKAAQIPFRVLKGTIGDLLKNLKMSNPSLVHTHGYKAGILGRATCLLTKTPVVSTFHSGERGQFPVSMYQTLDEMSSFLAPAIAVSEPIRERLPKSTALVHNFIDMPEKATDPTRTRLRAGFVGRFSHEKAPDNFCSLSEMLGVAPAFQNVTWHAYGDGPMFEEIKDRADETIYLHGLQIDMANVWPTLDLLVLPSRAEGLPLAVLEAMSHGIPVVAPKLGALPDVITHGVNGWLFEPNQLDEAADYMMEWAEMTVQQRQVMFENCRAHIAENFSVHARLKTMIEIYQQSGFKEKQAA